MWQMYNCLSFIVKRLETFLECTEEFQCHQMAMKHVIDVANKELQGSAKPLVRSASGSTRANTQRPRKASIAVPLLRRRDTRRRSSLQADEEAEPEQQLLRNLGISIPENRPRAEILEHALRDRLRKLGSHTTSLQSTTESSISSHLHNADISLQLLYHSLLDESVYHEVQFLDPDIKSSLATFESEVEDLQKSMESIDLQKLQAKDTRRDQLIKRWSR